MKKKKGHFEKIIFSIFFIKSKKLKKLDLKQITLFPKNYFSVFWYLFSNLLHPGPPVLF